MATVECTKAKGAAKTHLIQFQLCYLPVSLLVVGREDGRGFFQMEGQAEKKNWLNEMRGNGQCFLEGDLY